VGRGGVEGLEAAVISGFLAFFHARKWLAELLLLALVVGGVWWFCQHLIDVGVQRERSAWQAKLVEAQRKADIETGRLQGRADAAEKAREQEQADLDEYRRTHALHGGLCRARNVSGTAGAEAARAHGGDEGASTAAGDLQSVPAGDLRARGSGEPDVRHLFDVLAGKADLLSAPLREYQAR
jgi:hypothetical protein